MKTSQVFWLEYQRTFPSRSKYLFSVQGSEIEAGTVLAVIQLVHGKILHVHGEWLGLQVNPGLGAYPGLGFHAQGDVVYATGVQAIDGNLVMLPIARQWGIHGSLGGCFQVHE